MNVIQIDKYKGCGEDAKVLISIEGLSRGNDSENNRHHWTQKGRLFLYDLLKSKRGVLPVIERGAA